MKYSFSFCIFFAVFLHCFVGTKCFDQATAKGDIMIGGLFPIHESVNVTVNDDGSESRACDRYYMLSLISAKCHCMCCVGLYLYIIYLIVIIPLLCRFSAARLVQSLIMVQAVEEINQKRELGNLTLGYLIRDSCGEATTALIQTQAFMMGNGE